MRSDAAIAHLTYAARDAAYTARVWRGLVKEAGDDERTAELYRVHKELSRIAAEMHTTGVYVHQGWLGFMRVCAAQEAEEKAAFLRSLVGDEKFPTTPNGMQSLIFKRHERKGIRCFGLPDPADKRMYTDSTKESISVDANSLLLLAATSDLPPELLKIIAAWGVYQKKKKRVGYLNSNLLAEATGPDGRLRPGWNSCGTDTMRFSCLVGETPIRTQRGVVRMDEVRVGDLVWTHQQRWRRVSATYDNGVQPVIDLRLSNGRTLTCTPDHRLFTNRGEWLAAGVLLNESMDAERRELLSSALDVPLARDAHSSGDRPHAEDSAPVRLPRAEDAHAPAGAESTGRSAILALEVRDQEPHARKGRGSTSQLEGGMRGRSGVLDYLVEREAGVRTSGSDDEASGHHSAPGGDGRSSHRRGPEEQRHRQSGARDDSGASADPLPSEEGQSVCAVEAIYTGGCRQVYDLSVEEDHSFEAAGVFAHNCKEPNVQNIEQLLRHMLAPAPGHVIVHADKRQLEIRVMAVVAADNVLQDAIDGGDVYSAEACDYFGRDPATFDPAGNKKDKAVRQAAKIIRLARQYWAQEMAVFMQALRQDSTFTFAMASALTKKFDKRYYRTVAYWHEELAKAKELGYSEGRILGGRRYYPRPPDPSEAVNYPIQRTAAELMNLEMIELDRRLKAEVPSARIIMQLHDAIDVECPEKDEEAVCRIVDSVMNREWTFCGVTRMFPIEMKVTRASEGGTWSEV